MFQPEAFVKELRKERFRHFTAELDTYSDHLSELRWQDKSRGMIDAVIFVFRDNTVFITGDLGDAVVNLSEPAELKKLARYAPSYFVDKFSCASDRYVFDEEKAFQVLEDAIESLKSGMREGFDTQTSSERAATEDQLEELDWIKEELKERFSRRDGFLNIASGELISRLSEYDSECIEWLELAGREIAPRVYMWLTALKMANEQLEAASATQNPTT